MNFVVLNGSPKGTKNSWTIQYVYYIQKKFPQHDFQIVDISQRIKKLETDIEFFQGTLDLISSADGILMASPVYFFLVPAGYKRFIELVSERDQSRVFSDKYVAVMTTSGHIFDHTAHSYLQAICDDWGMRYVDKFSAEVFDLTRTERQKQLVAFFSHFLKAIENNAFLPKRYAPIKSRHFEYLPGAPDDSLDVGEKKVLIVTDAEEQQSNLLGMIQRFQAAFTKPPDVVNLHDLSIKGSCVGCFQCVDDNCCVYEDEFTHFFNKKVKTSDILIFAGAIKDRYLSSRWKLFFDRSFFNNHIPALRQKQFGFIIAGPLSQNSNLQEIFEEYTQHQRANLGGFVTDEYGSSEEIDRLLQDFAMRLLDLSNRDYTAPQTFLGVGAHMMLGELVWSARLLFQADHRYYRKMGYYNFSKEDTQRWLLNRLLPPIYTIFPRARRAFLKRFNSLFTAPLRKIVEEV